MPLSERRLKTARFTAAALGLLLAGFLWAPSDSVEVSQEEELQLRNVVLPVQDPARNEPHVGLTGRVRRVIRNSISSAVDSGMKQGSAHISFVLKELGVDGALVDIDGAQSLRPASNLKLATTAAALTLLGAAASFETHFDCTFEPSGGVIAGDLVVRAGADPLYMAGTEGRVDELLRPWIESLLESGVREVKGDLVLDLGAFPEPSATPGWPSSDQHWNDYCALSSGFSVNGGCVTVKVQAGRVGAPAKVTVNPVSYGMTLDLNVSTSPKRSALTVAAVVSRGRVRVRGNLPADVPLFIKRFAHPDPVDHFAGVLQHELAALGVLVHGNVKRSRGVFAPVRLASMKSDVIETLEPINTHSNNAVADQLFFKLGFDVTGDGGRAGGERAVLTALERLGVDSAGWRQLEGSGLSRNNRVSAAQLVMLLDAVLSEPAPISDFYAQSLAVAGESGTLAGRMVGSAAEGMVLAKTGFIGGTSALSGLARGQSGRVYIFSVLVNYPTAGGLNRNVWKPMQDSICELVVRYG
jgi:D-alanyl-D-alanine carboxypeptidase/D-alanyl-D-alanine-endopeptidase (penicillin-binding protein 4)